eukprot:TRINITY_DN5453_c0_g4_i1.p1 TRINITY_DN5453_c0_g4~~TRINITY_DN5453_c0_g4_i1.p1  ORF type:complete len:468 (+),score=133.32 TRINITY_DN5453_c0_g4_i1:104-1507(+)
MSSSFQWVPLTRDYKKENEEKLRLPREVTEQHPLQPPPEESETNQPETDTKTPAKSGPPAQDFVDPLSALNDRAFGDVVDFSAASSAAILSAKITAQKPKVDDRYLETFVPWASKKSSILQRYTTDERIGIQVNFMDAAPAVNVPVDKVKNRLEQLDETPETQQKEMLNLSQKDYVTHIENLHSELFKAWNNDERVKSLKIAIQCAKVLSDTQVIKFYPSKFVLVTEILDSFGNLVYDRIKKRSVTYDRPGGPARNLPDVFEPEDVSDLARETCRNWFFKIASIRELLPRLYVEMAILRSYNFLTKNAFPEVLERLKGMARGIGDPLVSAYCMAYLARKGKEVAPMESNYLLGMYNDTMLIQNTLKNNEKLIKSLTLERKISLTDYYNLYSPAFDWLLQCIAHNAKQETLTQVLKKFAENNNSIVLYHIISSFGPEYVAANATQFTSLIKACDTTAIPCTNCMPTWE